MSRARFRRHVLGWQLLTALGLRLAFTGFKPVSRCLQTAVAAETAPPWALDMPRSEPSEPSESERAPIPSPAPTAIDEIIGNMAVDSPEVVRARIAGGDMNFEDFIATTMAMSNTDAGALSLPTGYEQIVAAMTLEERRNPAVFRQDSASERIAQLSRDAEVNLQLTTTFLQDFGSIQRFFARMQRQPKSGSKASAALGESMQMAAEYLAEKPRGQRRAQENRNRLLKKAGRELREKKAKQRRGFD
ncbi:unnamed protein product [Effrenium voratum]|uniref:Uncharacterized protein n=1 Tax=Effrenium voratum TaxID=2562239 RepID=A0AA36NKR5_9DINO|nr:unnamed protein product [Effrenium voratum]